MEVQKWDDGYVGHVFNVTGAGVVRKRYTGVSTLEQVRSLFNLFA
jgi:hypothetical protein